MTLPKVAVLVGPTAVGKTAVALHLAEALGAEIVNADSLQVYRELDIGTAKPTAAEQARVRHHLLDVADPDEHYDAACYASQARQAIAGLHRRGVPPLVVGGTGLYIKALLAGLFHQDEVMTEVRARLAQELAEQGLAALFARLTTLDPATAQRLAPGDTYRILRALEVVEATGRPISELQAGHNFDDRPYTTLKLGLDLPRQELYRRIDERVKRMLEEGWLGEVRELLKRYPASIKPLQALGYRHLVAYLEVRLPLPEAIEQTQKETRRYAKRQLTWFRADPEIRWFHPGQTEDMLALLRGFFGNEG
jgi:tRNA dimethylallyltransferase|uniref:tRNA dimethylallyltransferase n=1 Tax=Desulfobacca acetoxidans TaxID=60893 RepID=A0A7V6A2X2_9BACT